MQGTPTVDDSLVPYFKTKLLTHHFSALRNNASKINNLLSESKSSYLDERKSIGNDNEANSSKI